MNFETIKNYIGNPSEIKYFIWALAGAFLGHIFGISALILGYIIYRLCMKVAKIESDNKKTIGSRAVA